MKWRIGATVFAAILFGFSQATLQGQEADEWWTGVWQGQLDGVPSVTITLVNDDGRPLGTAVFKMVKREGSPHVIASQASMLDGTSVAGSLVHFKVNTSRRGELQFDLKETADNTADLKCTSCADAPHVQVVREVYPKE